jgi:hypothetical protein
MLLQFKDTKMGNAQFRYHQKYGSTECVNGWWRLTPMVMNPLCTTVGGLNQFLDDVVLDVKWTHRDDLKNIYGTNAQGYASIT